MDDRPKRQIKKPPRYKTTSSDEAPTTSRTTARNRNMDEEIRDLRGIFQENSSQNTYSDITTPIPAHYIPPQTQNQYLQLQTPTHIQPYSSLTLPSTYTEQQHNSTHIAPTTSSLVSHDNQVNIHTNVPRQFQDQVWNEQGHIAQDERMDNDEVNNNADNR